MERIETSGAPPQPPTGDATSPLQAQEEPDLEASPISEGEGESLRGMILGLQQQLTALSNQVAQLQASAAWVPSASANAHGAPGRQVDPGWLFPSTKTFDPASPLTWNLQMQPVPTDFKVPSIPTFGPESDPKGHVVNYNIHMDLRTDSEALKCLAFPATLDQEGKMWYASLAPLSVQSFGHLVYLFENRFANQRRRPITTAHLMTIRQGPNESLRAYFDRFNNEARRVPRLPSEVYIPSVIQGIRSAELKRELALRPPKTDGELNETIIGYIASEENEAWQIQRDRALVDSIFENRGRT